MFTVEARPKTKAFQAPAFSRFTLNKHSYCFLIKEGFPYVLVIVYILYWQKKNVFLSPNYVSMFKYVLIQIPQTETMPAFVCKELIYWVNYHKEYKEQNGLTQVNTMQSQKIKTKIIFYCYSSNLILCFIYVKERTYKVAVHLITVTFCYFELSFQGKILYNKTSGNALSV